MLTNLIYCVKLKTFMKKLPAHSGIVRVFASRGRPCICCLSPPQHVAHPKEGGKCVAQGAPPHPPATPLPAQNCETEIA